MNYPEWKIGFVFFYLSNILNKIFLRNMLLSFKKKTEDQILVKFIPHTTLSILSKHEIIQNNIAWNHCQEKKTKLLGNIMTNIIILITTKDKFNSCFFHLYILLNIFEIENQLFPQFFAHTRYSLTIFIVYSY